MPGIAETIPAIFPGTVIMTKDSKIYRVKKLTGTKMEVRDAVGKDWIFKNPSTPFLNSLTDLHSGPEYDRFVAEEIANTVFFRVGNVCTWPDAQKAEIRQQVWVVTKVNADGDCNLSPLGGNLTGQYMRAVPAANLKKLDGEVTVSNA